MVLTVNVPCYVIAVGIFVKTTMWRIYFALMAWHVGAFISIDCNHGSLALHQSCNHIFDCMYVMSCNFFIDYDMCIGNYS